MSEFEVQSGKHMLVLSSSQFDPQRTIEVEKIRKTTKAGRSPRVPISPFSCEYAPFAGDTFEGLGAAVVEVQPRAGH
jgi:hypothetical protein